MKGSPVRVRASASLDEPPRALPHGFDRSAEDELPGECRIVRVHLDLVRKPRVHDVDVLWTTGLSHRDAAVGKVYARQALASCDRGHTAERVWLRVGRDHDVVGTCGSRFRRAGEVADVGGTVGRLRVLESGPAARARPVEVARSLPRSRVASPPSRSGRGRQERATALCLPAPTRRSGHWCLSSRRRSGTRPTRPRLRRRSDRRLPRAGSRDREG
jgi:hypothetical protein